MKLVPRQRTILKRYLRDSPKILILEGAVRSGKTFLNNAIFYMLVRGQTGAGKHFIITGHTLGSIKRNVLEPMSMDLGLNAKMDNNGMLRMFGNFVHCFGSDRADSYKAMTGMTGAGWYANEVTLQHDNSIQEAFNRCSDPDAQIIWDTNPDYPEHPIKLNFIDCSGERLSSGRLRIQAFHFQLDDNPTLSGEYIENLKRSTASGMWYDRRIKGLWTAAEGLVYEDWNPEVHVVDPFPIPEDWPRYRAIDLGYNNPFVCLWGAQDHDGRLYIYDEHYYDHKLIKWHAERIKRREEKVRWTVRDHEAQEGAELEDCGIDTWPAQKDVDLGIQKVALRLRVQADGKPQLMIFRTCQNSRREMGMYRWQERKDNKPVKEEPMKVNDHTCLIAGTMIKTNTGSKPIETIHSGEFVWTRMGWRRIIAAGMTEKNARIVTVKIGNSQISGTSNHKIYVNNKWAPLDALRYIDIMNVCKLKPSYFTESSFGAIPNQRIGLIAIIIDHIQTILKRGLGHYIERFGKTPLGQFLQECWYIIKTRIQQITDWKIYNCLQGNNTILSISGESALQHNAKIWNTYEKRRKFGIDRPKDELGTKSMHKRCGKEWSHINEYAMSAGRNMRLARRMGVTVSVPMHAKQEVVSSPVSISKRENAKDVGKNLQSINIPLHATAQENVQGWHVESERKPVYNLTIEDTHEFFANGILVHNCDAIRYLTVEIDSGGFILV